MRPGATRIAALAALAAVALTSACTKHEETHDSASVGGDIKAAGQDLGKVARDVTHSPGWKDAAADLKAAGHDAGKDTRKAAAEAKAALRSLSADAKGAAHDATKGDDN